MANSSWNFKRTLRRSRLLFWPTVFAVIMYGVWRGVDLYYGHYFSSEDTQLLGGIAGLVAAFHAIIAALTLSKADSGRRDMHRALNCGEYVQFVDLRDERIFWPIHWMLGSFSGIIIVCVMIIHYATEISGVCVVSGVSWVLAMYWQAALVTDNPLNSAWYRDDDVQIPEEFRTITRAQAELRMAEEKIRREMVTRFLVRPYETGSAQFQQAASRFANVAR